MKIEVISGSPRQGSITQRVAKFLERHLAENSEHEVGLINMNTLDLPNMQKVWTTIDDVPDEFKTVAERMFAADAYIIVTPEYNGSYSPAMQNFFDHFPKRHHKPFGLVTASPGALGGVRAAMQLQQFVLALFGIPSPYMLLTPAVDKKFDAEGNLLDGTFQNAIDTFVKEFLWLAEKVVEEKVPA